MGDLKNSEDMEIEASQSPKDEYTERSLRDIDNEVEDVSDEAEDINCELNNIKIEDQQNVVQFEGINLDIENTLSVKEELNVVQDHFTQDEKPSVDKQRKANSKGRLTKCEFCSKEIRTRHYKQHFLMHKGIRNFKCEICNRTFVLKTQLNQHMKIHVGVKEFKCHICGKEFLLKTGMQRHIAVHTGQKEFRCEICGKEYSVKTRLKRHMMSHTEAKGYECHLCSKSYSQKCHLKAHLKMAHSDAIKDFRCERCGKTFNRMSHLNSHLRTHIGIKDFKCEICNMEFIHKGSLKYHMSKHSGFSDFERPGSDKLTNNMAVNIDEKESVNSDRKKFRCEICGKGLARKTNLRNHMLTHSKKRREDEMVKISEPEFVFIEMENFCDVKEETSSNNDREVSPSDRSVADMEYPSLKMEENPLSEDYIPSEFDDEVYDNIVIKEECSDGIFLL